MVLLIEKTNQNRNKILPITDTANILFGSMFIINYSSINSFSSFISSSLNSVFPPNAQRKFVREASFQTFTHCQETYRPVCSDVGKKEKDYAEYRHSCEGNAEIADCKSQRGLIDGIWRETPNDQEKRIVAEPLTLHFLYPSLPASATE